MKLYEFYFSPTGGTKRVMEVVGAAWDCEKRRFDLADAPAACDEIKFEAEDVCLFAVPSFSGRVPQFIIPKLQRLKGNGAKAVLIAAYGNRDFDDTLLELKNALEGAGFLCAAGLAAVTQHSIMPDFGAGRPDARDLEELKGYALKCKEAAANATSAVAVPGNRPYREYMAIPIRPKAGKLCNECGLCAKKCPVNAISPSSIHTAGKDKCISCLRCVAVCPNHARQLNRFMLRVAKLKMKKACGGRKSNQLFLAK